MVGSPLLALLLLLPPSWVVDCADVVNTSIAPPLPWTAFDPKTCEMGTRVFCLLPIACASGSELFQYFSPSIFTPCGVQIVLRYFTEKKLLVDIWSEGSLALFNDKNDETIFGCQISDGKMIVKAEAKEVKLISEDHTNEALFCRLLIESDEPILPKQSPPTRDKYKLLSNSNKYEKLYKELYFENERIDSCDVSLIKSITHPSNAEYVFMDIPYVNLFQKSITCPENWDLIFEKSSKLIEYSQILCELEGDNFVFKTEGNNKKVTRNSNLKAGCRRKVCDMCSTPNWACRKKDGCHSETIDDCTVYKCQLSHMTVNAVATPAEGDIRCTQKKDEPRAFGWTFIMSNGSRSNVEQVTCPSELNCTDVSPLNCIDAQGLTVQCEDILDIGASVRLCRGAKQMRVQHGGSETNVTSLACNERKGKYKMQLVGETDEPELPDRATISCTVDEPTKVPTQPNTGQTPLLYVAIGSTFLVIAIVVVIVIVCCLRQTQRRKDAASKAPGTTTTASKTTLRTTKTTSAESKTPVRTMVPIPPPTPIAAAVPLQRAEADIKPWDPNLTERTPNAPTPLCEQRTQDQPTDRRERSKTKSLSMAEPPKPKAETAQPEGEDSKSGVESTKTKVREDKTFKRFDDWDPNQMLPTKRESTKTKVREDKTFKRCDDWDPNQMLPPKRRRASSPNDRSRSAHPLHPTQGEESTKQTQKDSTTKTKTQRTQDMRTDEAGANEEAARIPARPLPKKPVYVAVPDVEEDSFDSEETKKSPLDKGPMKAPAKTPVEHSPYLKLEDLMSERQLKKMKKKEKEEKKMTEKDGI